MNKEERRKLHPELGGMDPDPYVNRERVAWWANAPVQCQCEQRKPCPVHDPVVDEGDWDA